MVSSKAHTLGMRGDHFRQTVPKEERFSGASKLPFDPARPWLTEDEEIDFLTNSGPQSSEATTT